MDRDLSEYTREQLMALVKELDQTIDEFNTGNMRVEAGVYPYINLWLDGQDVTNVTQAASISPNEGETVDGWARMFVLDAEGNLMIDGAGEAVTKTVCGKVRWEYAE